MNLFPLKGERAIGKEILTFPKTEAIKKQRQVHFDRVSARDLTVQGGLMLIEISVACIAAAFIVLVVFAVIAIVKSIKTLNNTNVLLQSTQKNLDETNTKVQILLKHADALAVNLKYKLHALDHFIKPLTETEHEIERKSKHLQHKDLITDILESTAAAIVLYSKIKEGISDYAKNR